LNVSWYNIIGITSQREVNCVGWFFHFFENCQLWLFWNFRKSPKFLDFKETFKLQRTGHSFILKFSFSEVNSHKGDNCYFSLIILFTWLSQFKNSNIFNKNENFQIKFDIAFSKHPPSLCCLCLESKDLGDVIFWTNFLSRTKPSVFLFSTIVPWIKVGLHMHWHFFTEN